MLDFMFERPIFRSSDLTKLEHMPTPQAVSLLLGKLKDAGILKVVREGSGQRPQVLVLAALFNLCEGKTVF